jgi:4-amino-4-deoxy-L-arabinose transferase-like glycosyltransferase
MTTKRMTQPAVWAGLIVLLLAAALRIYHITQQSIWFDEAFAWNIVIQDDMFPRIATDTHPPLYYVLLRGWMSVAGDSALSLRYLSALISLGTVALIWQVGREVALRRTGWGLLPFFAALLLALSDAEIFLAQEARNYAPYTFFACLSMWGYLRWLRRADRLSAGLWVIGTVALVYIHYQGLFIPAVQGLHALIFLRGRRRVRAVGWLAVSGLCFAPWFLLVTVPQAQNAIDNSLPFAIPSNWDTFLGLRDRYLGAVWALLIVLAGFGWWRLAHRDRAYGPAFILLMWLIVPFAVLFFGNYFAALLTERKLLIVAPAIALLVGLGLTQIERPAQILVMLAVVVYGVTAVDYYRVKEPWNAIAQPALTLGGPADLYLAQVEVGQYPMKYYWQRNMPPDAVFATFPFLGDPTMAPTTDHPTYYNGFLPQTLFPYNRENRVGPVATAWVVYWSKDDTLLRTLETHEYVRTATWTTDHIGNTIDLYRYDTLPEEPTATFANGMILRAAELDPQSLRADLWWSVAEPLARDYIVSLAVLDASGALVAQIDSPPPVPTSALLPGDVIYEGRVPESAASLPPGDYRLVVRVYTFDAAGHIVNVATQDGADFVVIGSLTR